MKKVSFFVLFTLIGVVLCFSKENENRPDDSSDACSILNIKTEDDMYRAMLSYVERYGVPYSRALPADAEADSNLYGSLSDDVKAYLLGGYLFLYCGSVDLDQAVSCFEHAAKQKCLEAIMDPADIYRYDKLEMMMYEATGDELPPNRRPDAEREKYCLEKALELGSEEARLRLEDIEYTNLLLNN